MSLYALPAIFVLMSTDNYLFIYGTLLDRNNEFAKYLQENCRFYAKGKFKGALYDIGEYPGALADENSPYYVYGSIFILKNTQSLVHLDDYEGFGHKQEQHNLFVREMIEIETSDSSINCWCYLYNLPVNGLKLIASGDYLKYKQND